MSAGSGIDVKALTEQLVAAEKAPRSELLDARQARVDARISALGQFRSALDALVGALGTRIGSGALSGIPAVSDTSVLSMTVDPGAVVQRQQLEVRSLARGQTLASAPRDAAAPVGLGTLTFRFGAVAGSDAATGFVAGVQDDLVVTVAEGDNSLEGLRNAINDAAAVAGAPLQAQIVSDTNGARLLLRGAMGEASGFTVEAAGEAGLGDFAFGEGVAGGLSRTQTATDAVVAIDGVELRRPSNSISDLVPGARLSLAKAAPGQIVTIEAARNTTQLSQSVRDVGAALNELAGLGRELSNGNPTSGSTGALVADGSTRRALQQLGSVATKQLIEPNGNAPTRLIEIGLGTDRNGNFTVDETRLAKAVANHPAAVEALITALNAPVSFTSAGGPLPQLAAAMKLAAEGSAGQPTALAREAAAITRDRTLLDQRMQRMTDTYTRQFAALDRAVGESRTMQDFLKQQIDMWTRSSDA
ncbi:flagellar filament capping protein FliD [Sandaracinobacteroides hominis]|uniref:flagellar filament capping protein FliD n=1 Tax=Sandaracinobacteroides hominis TaxID=2780086 RepID=UPI0018F38501|nr:flagellar filament capping protein FliD [Sandaracinobacteroides hominis]